MQLMTFLKNTWYVAAHSHELTSGLVSRKICNEPIVMFRTAAGAIAALRDRCPHRFVPLSMGKRIGDTLQCGYHGLSFDASGACASAPNENDEQKARICVQAYTAVERYNVIWLWLGAAESADPALIPRFDFMSDAEHFAVARGYSHIKANAEILADNLLDLSHVHYLHPQIPYGSDFSQFTNKLKVEGDTVWSMLWRHHFHLDAARQKIVGVHAEDLEGQGHSRWNAPGNLLVDTGYWEHGKSKEEGFSTPSAHLLTPETEFSTHYFWGTGRTYDIHNTELTRATEAGNHHIFETQDGPMCEAQQAALGQDNDFLAARPMILRADAAGLAARRIMKRKRREEAELFGTAPGVSKAG
jgi:phenylpropionate dioxygenase-like ring-hydroxylating dioxygenase large terminal subunit